MTPIDFIFIFIFFSFLSIKLYIKFYVYIYFFNRYYSSILLSTPLRRICLHNSVPKSFIILQLQNGNVYLENSSLLSLYFFYRLFVYLLYRLRNFFILIQLYVKLRPNMPLCFPLYTSSQFFNYL